MPFPSKVSTSGQPPGAGLDDPVQVKRLHVGGGPAGQLLQLPFPDPHPGRAGDRGLRGLHRAARGLDGGELPQPVGVLLLRQVQRRVQKVHVAPSRRPVGDPRHRDLPEPRHQRPVRPLSARVRTTPSSPVTSSRRSSPAASRSRCPWNSLRSSSRPRSPAVPPGQHGADPAAPRQAIPLSRANCSLAPAKASSRQAGAYPCIGLLLVRSGREITRTVTRRSPLNTHRHEQTGHQAACYANSPRRRHPRRAAPISKGST